MIKINIKPLSVNEAWQGKRFKTAKYKQYEHNVILMLPKLKVPDAPLKLYLILGMSNVLSDFDNPVKLITDILQKKYSFNDRDISEAHIFKIKVKKGEEYFKFSLEKIDLF